jgi:putative tryptophan/tyrosine transport system substrate-binding protein
VRRREFITLLGGVAAGWPLAVRAQERERMRRIGVLLPQDETDQAVRPWMAALKRGLADLGWVEGRNLRVDVRWNPKTSEQTRMFIDELIALQPDVLVTGVARLVLAVQERTKTIPIVFIGAGDPLARGLVSSISHPGGNTTGVTDLLPGLGGKWLELLKECMPTLTRVALIQNSALALPGPLTGNTNYLSATEAGPHYGVTVTFAPVANLDDIETKVRAFTADPGGGLIVLPPPLPDAQRRLLNGLAIRYGLPALYQERSFAVEGGLLAYGTDFLNMFGHDAPPYINKILRGVKPGELPVQFPTKFILTVNTTTARAMGLKIPESFLARADELIE